MQRSRNHRRGDEREARARRRALATLALVRRKQLWLAEACRLEDAKPATLFRYVGRAPRQDRPWWKVELHAVLKKVHKVHKHNIHPFPERAGLIAHA